MTDEAKSWIGVGHVARRAEGVFEEIFFPVAFWADSRAQCEALLRDFAPHIDPAMGSASLSGGVEQGDVDPERGLFWLESLLTAEQRAALSPLSAAEKSLILAVSDINPVAIGQRTHRKTEADTTTQPNAAKLEQVTKILRLGDPLNWDNIIEHLPATRIVYAPGILPRFFKEAFPAHDIEMLTEVGDSFFPLAGHSSLRILAEKVRALGSQSQDACQFFGFVPGPSSASGQIFGSVQVENFFETQTPCVADVGTVAALHATFPDAFGQVDPDIPLDEAKDVLFMPLGNGAVEVLPMPRSSIAELAASVKDETFHQILLDRHVKMTTGHVLVDRFGEGERLVEMSETYHHAIFEIFRILARHDKFFPYAFEDMLVPTLMAAVNFGIPLHTLPQAVELAGHEKLPIVNKISFLAGMRFSEEHRELLEKAVNNG